MRNIINLVDLDGNINLLSPESEIVTVATLKYGQTYGATNTKNRSIARLTIIPGGRNSISDVFIFYSNDMPFTHIQSKIINPYLFSIYLALLTDEKDRSIEQFMSIIIADYFIGHLKYKLLSNNITFED
jgi:hypothetical protein